MSTLDRLAKAYGTDKSSDNHNYCVKYEKYIPFKRYDKINILEIGVHPKLFHSNRTEDTSNYFH